MSITVPPWSNKIVQQQQNTQTQNETAVGTTEPARLLNFEISPAKSMFLYRLGIGELQFNPKNMQMKESISINTNVENGIYAKTNPFVSYTNTNRIFTFSFILPADASGFRLLADSSSPINTTNVNNGENGVTPIMNVLKSFLYANYEITRDTSNSRMISRTIKSPPVFKLVNKSIVSNGNLPQTMDASQQIGREYGLLGFITDFKLDPLFGIGYVQYSQGVRTATEDQAWEGSSFKEVAVSFTFIPIFEQALGWASEETSNYGFTGAKELGGIGNANTIKNILKG